MKILFTLIIVAVISSIAYLSNLGLKIKETAKEIDENNYQNFNISDFDSTVIKDVRKKNTYVKNGKVYEVGTGKNMNKKLLFDFDNILTDLKKELKEGLNIKIKTGFLNKRSYNVSEYKDSFIFQGLKKGNAFILDVSKLTSEQKKAFINEVKNRNLGYAQSTDKNEIYITSDKIEFFEYNY